MNRAARLPICANRYVNPGETKRQIAAKRKQAVERGEMIERVPPNAKSPRSKP